MSVPLAHEKIVFVSNELSNIHCSGRMKTTAGACGRHSGSDIRHEIHSGDDDSLDHREKVELTNKRSTADRPSGRAGAAETTCRFQGNAARACAPCRRRRLKHSIRALAKSPSHRRPRPSHRRPSCHQSGNQPALSVSPSSSNRALQAAREGLGLDNGGRAAAGLSELIFC